MLAPSPSELHMGSASTRLGAYPRVQQIWGTFIVWAMERGTWTVLLLQIRIAVQNSQHSYRPFPHVSLDHEAEPTLHLRFCPRLHLTSP